MRAQRRTGLPINKATAALDMAKSRAVMVVTLKLVIYGEGILFSIIYFNDCPYECALVIAHLTEDLKFNN